MKTVKMVKNIKVDSGTVQKGSTVLIAIGTILKAGVEIAKALSKLNK